jgi:hypothetical protein
MRRLTEALERAELNLNESTRDVLRTVPPGNRVDVLGEGGTVAGASPGSMRLPAVTQADATTDELAASRMSLLPRCPRCDRVHRARAEAPGLWERILSAVRIQRYQCDFCGCRFRRFGAKEGDSVTDGHGARLSSTFLPAADHRDFNEIIRDLAHAEREQQRGQGLDPQQPRTRPHPREPRESSPRPAGGNASEDRSARVGRSDWSGQ